MTNRENEPTLNTDNSQLALPNPFDSFSDQEADGRTASRIEPNSAAANKAHAEQATAGNIAAQLDVQFSLRKDLLFGQSESTLLSAPQIISLVAAMANPELPGSNCLLIPVRENVAAVTAVLIAFQSTVAHFPSLLQNYLEKSFQRGERVRVLPEGYVYVFDGRMKHGGKHFFSLKFLDDPSNATRSFPIHEAVRLEKTNARSPKGSGKPWANFQRSKLDFIIGTSAGGNNALLSNEVILATTQKSFSDFLASVYVASSLNPEHYFPLEDLIPWGTIGADGNIEFRNSAAAAGSPLIAVASRPEYIATFCRLNENASSVVIVDGADWVRDLQALDDIIDSTSKLLIVADHSELDQLPAISNRGVQIFRLPGSARNLVGKGSAILSRFQRAADCADNFKFKKVECESNHINEISDHILRAEKEIRDSGADETFLAFIGIAYSRLLDIASLLSEPDEEVAGKVIADLNAVAVDILARRNFLPIKAFYNLRSAYGKLCKCIDGSSQDFFGHAKQVALAQLLDASTAATKGRTVVICQSGMAVASVNKLLQSKVCPNVSVSTLNSFLAGDTAERVILTGWPRSRYLDKLLNSYEAAEITVLAYGFESLWFRSSIRRRERSISRWQSSGSLLQKITGLIAATENEISFEMKPDPIELASEEIEKFEATFPIVRKGRFFHGAEPQALRSAKYVGFVGQSYCYLTQTHEVPKVTAILRATPSSSGGIRSVTVSDLVCGDRVLFRMSSDSDKDMIRLLAETLSPPGQYERTRDAASSWKHLLNKVGSDVPEIVEALRSYGLHRNQQTVRNWINNPNLIGPAAKSDLASIVRAAGDSEYAGRIDDVWGAIEKTRGDHMTAGFKLSQLLIREIQKQMPDLSTAEAIVELTTEQLPFGRVAIVEIEDISDVFEDRSYVEVNRLLW